VATLNDYKITTLKFDNKGELRMQSKVQSTQKTEHAILSDDPKTSMA